MQDLFPASSTAHPARSLPGGLDRWVLTSGEQGIVLETHSRMFACFAKGSSMFCQESDVWFMFCRARRHFLKGDGWKSTEVIAAGGQALG